MSSLTKLISTLARVSDTKLALLNHSNVQIISSAKMSQYPKYFIDPTFRNDELNALYETGEVKEKALVPCRAALTEHTSSEFYSSFTRKFINHVMRKGNKQLAREVVEKAFEVIKKTQIQKYHSLPPEKKVDFTIRDPHELFHQAVINVKPIMVLTPIKRGGVRYQVPVPVDDLQATILAYKWFIEASKDKERTVRFYNKLAKEIMDAANNTGRVVKKKLDLHKQCEANRAYAHYRWN
ncbi:Hypothetical predicted protein [Cloeon dipterum]|uniref:Small ribosomal subunit protein uS7 domain-containing protein n=1 Tax=Cloeon dipterum TaxID=197152 RepID=A0A8S1CRX1_9INSE|nr:Hypothetical predicted protein [Cloeon dipterum]